MSLNLGTILQAAAADRPKHVAIRMDERVLTYAQLDRAARGSRRVCARAASSPATGWRC